MTRRRLIEIALLVLLAAVLGFYVYDRLGVRMGGTPSSLQSRFKTEEDWLLDEILRDIVEMCAYARGSAGRARLSLKREAGEGLRLPQVKVEVSLADGSPQVSRVFSLEGSFWNPLNYSELAADLLPPLERTTASLDFSLIKALLEPRVSVLEKENQRISSRLASSMLDASAHEEAALLLGVFGLREAAYRFGDLRPLRCRITAHLAMARALRGSEAYGPNGVFGEVTLLALLGRQEEAFAAVNRLSANSPSAGAAWVNALYMYMTGDWRRPGSDPESLLEKLQRFRALVGTLGSTAAVERIGEQVHGEPADWGRIVASEGGGAASDRPFIASQMGKEIAELQEVRTLTHGRPLSPDGLAEALNEPASRCLTVDGPRVIAWGTWAAFYQRHICGLISVAEENLRGALGMPEWADTYGQRADTLFESLTLYPIVDVRRTRKYGGRVEDTVGMPATIVLARERPELVNVFNWEYMADTAGHMMIRRGMPRAAAWFSAAVLVTSVFDTHSRFRVLRTAVNEEEMLAALRQIAPRHAAVLYLGLERHKGKELNVEVVAKEFGDRVEYDLYALGRIRQAAGDDREDAAPILEKMCDLDANECAALGWTRVRTGAKKEAAAAFERAVAEAPDRILVCNNCRWLVHYYLDEGRKDKALQVATMVADVYCYEGLRTMAELQERLGHMARAEQWYARIAERYDSERRVSYPLLAFYYRMARERGGKEYEQRFVRLLGRVFPDGLEPLPQEHDTAPPRDGLLIDGVSKRLTDSGLRGADVIVGLNGFRVRSLEQYDAILWFRQRTWDMSLRVWRQAQYLDFQPHVPFLHFGVRVRTFGTPGPSFEHR